jgi:ATP-dependent protease HslVU (ClpYQ) peptidase subunit
MTTIAYDGRFLSADMQHTFGGTSRYQQPRSKIKRIRFGDRRFVTALSGTEPGALVLIEWYVFSRGGRDVAGYPLDAPALTEDRQANVLIAELFPDGQHKVVHVSSNGAVYEATGPYAIGSGTDFAEGAMAAGAPSFTAVEIAAKFDVFTGMGVEAVDLKDHPRDPALFTAL